MKRCSSLVCAVALSGASAGSADEPESVSWAGFRGSGNSLTRASGLPVTWSAEEKLAWRVDLAGFGQSSPVRWGESVYVTSTDGDHKELLFLERFHVASGERIWAKEFEAGRTVPEVTRMISRGAPTPAADGDGIYLFFESGDLLALTHAGEERWRRNLMDDYGSFQGGHGIGTSLLQGEDWLVLLIDHEGPSYLLCVDKGTGATRWRTERPPRVSWTTPLLVEHGGQRQIVVSSNGVVEGFRFADGERLWWVEGIDGNTVSSPTQSGDLVVVGSSDPKQSLAIRLGGRGNVSESHVAWRAESVTCSFGSPLISGDRVYFVNRAGALQVTSLEDGSLLWERRLPDSCWASPLAAGGRLYFFAKNGVTTVLEQENGTANQLAENPLPVAEGDVVYGFAVAPGGFIIRTSREMFAVGDLQP